MGELRELLKNTLADEKSANDEYGKLIETIEQSSLTDEEKILAITIVEKIKIDEQTHYEMLSMIKSIADTK